MVRPLAENVAVAPWSCPLVAVASRRTDTVWPTASGIWEAMVRIQISS